MFPRFFKRSSFGMSVGEATSEFKSRASELIQRGDQAGLQELYVGLTAKAMLEDGEGAIQAMRSALAESVLESKRGIKRGKFDHLKPKGFRDGY